MGRTPTQWLGWTTAVGVALLFATANLSDIPLLWSLNFYSYFSPVWTYAALAVIAISFLPVARNGLIQLSDTIAQWCADSRHREQLVVAGTALLIAILCWLFSNQLPLLGDGSLRCREIVDGKLWQPTEALDFFLHACTYNRAIKPLGLEVTQAYRYISVFAGMAFIFGLYRLCRYLSPLRWPTWMLSGVSLGITPQFFGYVESYSIIAALIPWLVLSGLKASDGSGTRLTFVLLVIFAIVVHAITAILFGVSMLVLARASSESRANWIRSHRLMVWSAVACALLLLLGAKVLGLSIVRDYVLPLFSTDQEPFGFLSITHLFNVLNWVLLSGLAITMLLPLAMIGRTDKAGSLRTVFAFSLIIPSVLFVLVFPPKLGGPIDWDLFALPMSVIGLAVLAVVTSDNKFEFPRWLFPIVVVALLNIAGFVAVNHSTPASAERFSRIIPVSHTVNPWIHWSSLVVHAEHKPELFSRRNEFLLKSWQAPPKNKRDSVTTLTKLLYEAVNANDSLSSRQLILLINGIADLPPEVLAEEVDAFIKFGRPEEKRGYAEMMATEFSNSPIALGAAGIVFLNLGDKAKCGSLLKRAYELDSSIAPVALNYGVFLANEQNYDSASSVLKRALQLNNSSFVAAYYLAHVSLALGDIESAKAATLRAEANALRPEEKERITQLKMRF